MPPITLFRYIAGRTLFSVCALGAALGSVVLLIDLVENLRFAAKVEAADFGFVLQMTLMRTPALALNLTPFIFLFGAIWTFNQLNRRAEIAVMRSAGVSIWRLIGPAAVVAAASGVALATLVDPMSSNLLSRAEMMKDAVRGKPSSLLKVFGDGIWLRQRDDDILMLINAASFDPVRGALGGVTMWRLDSDLAFIERVDATEAVLAGRTIELREARIKGVNDQFDHRMPVYALATNLSAQDLRERADRPETVSIWRMPRFIQLAKAAGMPTIRYTIRYHDLWSTPLKLVAMVLIAAIFSLRPVRSGGTLTLFLAAIGAGFALYILSQISRALGESGAVPEALAAWMPAIIATIFAVTSLLHIEEG